MDTFKRLNLGLVLQTGATLVIAVQAISLRNNLLTGGCVGGCKLVLQTETERIDALC